ncbi:hypothetical protein [Flavobacterium bernardetii]|uniref:hypothetical protein n=1 Tax=Flavobacterium bernardetii TaxID=2813823 RepID=UPI001CEDCD81|nr:hypothetical protein [Flavobacterium bernardetii]
MNYIKHLTAFFEKVSQEPDLNPTHISLYLAIFQSWNSKRFQNPITISRVDMMRTSKIGSITMYHNCLKKLDDKGYIKYQPSDNPFKGSLVHIIELTEAFKVKKNSIKTKVKNEQVAKQANEQVTILNSKQALVKHCTSNEQALVSNININKHIKHYKHSIAPTKNKTENNLLNNSENEEKKWREKKTPVSGSPIQFKNNENDRGNSDSDSTLPILENVITFFKENNQNQIEAETFFYSFESNGWLVGGKTKIKNWEAAAKNWMLNRQIYSTNFRNPEQASVKHSRSVEGQNPIVCTLDTQKTLTNRCTTFEETFEVIATTRIYNFNKCVAFITYQGKKKFGQAFKIYESDLSVMHQLLVYAIKDEKSAAALNIDLSKGILLSGKNGCGKTAIMHLLKPFLPPKFDYKIKTCREVSFEFAKKGSEALEIYTQKSNKQNRLTGYCFDDFGTEHQIKHFGNDSNVVAKIILNRYEQFVENKTVTHLTTNLSMLAIEKFYGSMVSTKIKQMFNVISFNSDTIDKR